MARADLCFKGKRCNESCKRKRNILPFYCRTTEEPSIAAKEALYAVLMHLLQDSAAVIVPPVLAHGDPPAAASARVLIGRAGSLQQCQPLAEDK